MLATLPQHWGASPQPPQEGRTTPKQTMPARVCCATGQPSLNRMISQALRLPRDRGPAPRLDDVRPVPYNRPNSNGVMVAHFRALVRDLKEFQSREALIRRYDRRYFSAQDLYANDVDLERWADAIVTTDETGAVYGISHPAQ